MNLGSLAIRLCYYGDYKQRSFRSEHEQKKKISGKRPLCQLPGITRGTRGTARACK